MDVFKIHENAVWGTYSYRVSMYNYYQNRFPPSSVAKDGGYAGTTLC